MRWSRTQNCDAKLRILLTLIKFDFSATFNEIHSLIYYDVYSLVGSSTNFSDVITV